MDFMQVLPKKLPGKQMSSMSPVLPVSVTEQPQFRVAERESSGANLHQCSTHPLTKSEFNIFPLILLPHWNSVLANFLAVTVFVSGKPSEDPKACFWKAMAILDLAKKQAWRNTQSDRTSDRSARFFIWLIFFASSVPADVFLSFKLLDDHHSQSHKAMRLKLTGKLIINGTI